LKDSNKSPYKVWFDLCKCRVSHQWKFVTSWYMYTNDV